jgi:osmoprotectant transport system permease protein
MIDALDYLLHSRESVGGGVQVGGSHLLPLLWTHVRVTLEAIVIAVAIALPVAVWLGHKGRGQLAASTAANVGRAVPSFAVLVFASTYIGLNETNLVFAMVLLAIPPIFTNTYVGIRQVEPDVVDAARGMGLTERRLALGVELPLALPPNTSGRASAPRSSTSWRPRRSGPTSASTPSACRSSTPTCTATRGAWARRC